MLFNGNNPKGYSGFDLLPDEIVMKIVKMALQNMDPGTNNCICPMGHNIKKIERVDVCYFRYFRCLKRTVLVRVISKISQRFKRLARDKSLKFLWSGLDTICGDESELTDIIQNMTDEVDIEILDVFGDFAARHESM